MTKIKGVSAPHLKARPFNGARIRVFQQLFRYFVAAADRTCDRCLWASTASRAKRM